MGRWRGMCCSGGGHARALCRSKAGKAIELGMRNCSAENEGEATRGRPGWGTTVMWGALRQLRHAELVSEQEPCKWGGLCLEQKSREQT